MTIVPLDSDAPSPADAVERAIERRRARRRRWERLYERASDLFFLLLIVATLAFFAFLLGLVRPVLYELL